MVFKPDVGVGITAPLHQIAPRRAEGEYLREKSQKILHLSPALLQQRGELLCLPVQAVAEGFPVFFARQQTEPLLQAFVFPKLSPDRLDVKAEAVPL